MGSPQTLVCVKQVKQEVAEDWDESMLLPGDMIEGFAEDDADELFVPTKLKSDLSSHLGKVHQQLEVIWVKVRRGDTTIKLQARIVQEKSSMLHKKHVAVLGDLTLEQCAELQDQHSSVVSSILFMPLQCEYCIEATTTRCMAWFSAAVSSGAPLVFVNIQPEQNVISESTNSIGREIVRGRQQNTTTVQIVQGIRLWFLPGVAEVSLELIPQLGEVRFRMDIKRIDEGFICVYSVTEGSAADRAGLGNLFEEAIVFGYLLVISRLEGKSVMPSNASCDGLIHCCDHNEIRDTLISSAIDQMDTIQLCIMAWPDQTLPFNTNIQPIASTAVELKI
ncbi:hypothetical protein ACB098_01G000900 [Castanea mollissima]